MNSLTRVVTRHYASFSRPLTDHGLEMSMEKSLSYKTINERLLNAFDTLARTTDKPQTPTETLFKHWKYTPVVRASGLPEAGSGVFLQGKCSAGDIVGIYPGLIYEPGDPVLWPTWRNDYFLRCSDGSSVDGKFYGISGWMYRSTVSRSRIVLSDGSTRMSCDDQWRIMSNSVRRGNPEGESNEFDNPLNTGHFINCASEGTRANVMYHEHVFTVDCPLSLRKFIPNVSYSSMGDSDVSDLLVKSVVMIALRTIDDGEELFSDYSFIGELQPEKQ